MSKEAAVRAMREARYAERRDPSRVAPRTAPVRPTAQAAPTGRPAPTAPVASPTPAADQTCGHRSMNGRTCTREKDHAAKNHRYS